MDAQFFGQHNAGQQVGPDGQLEKVLDLGFASGQRQPAAGGQAHLLIAVVQSFDKQVAGLPAAGLVGGREGEVGEGAAAADHVARCALGAPPADQSEIQGKSAEAVAGAAAHRSLKLQNGCGDIGGVGADVTAQERIVRAARQEFHQGSPQGGTNLGGSSPACAERSGAAHRHQQQHQEKHDARAHQGDRRVQHQGHHRPTHRRASRLTRATSSSGLKGFTM